MTLGRISAIFTLSILFAGCSAKLRSTVKSYYEFSDENYKARIFLKTDSTFLFYGSHSSGPESYMGSLRSTGHYSTKGDSVVLVNSYASYAIELKEKQYFDGASNYFEVNIFTGDSLEFIVGTRRAYLFLNGSVFHRWSPSETLVYGLDSVTSIQFIDSTMALSSEICLLDASATRVDLFINLPQDYGGQYHKCGGYAFDDQKTFVLTDSSLILTAINNSHFESCYFGRNFKAVKWDKHMWNQWKSLLE
jgi:hypothetical protein